MEAKLLLHEIYITNFRILEFVHFRPVQIIFLAFVLTSLQYFPKKIREQKITLSETTGAYYTSAYFTNGFALDNEG